MKKYRTWVEIDLEAVAGNLKALKQKLSPEVKVLVVTKANAYGHGAVPITKTVFEHGADMVGVGDSTEAIELRKAGLLGPILILGAIIEEEMGWVVSYDIIPSLHSIKMVETLNTEAKRQNVKLKVHMKIDTGMGRLGISPRGALALARRINEASNLQLEGVFTHFSSAATGDMEFTRAQFNTFLRVTRQIEEAGIKIPLRHAANTPALCALEETHLDMVRAGAGILGIDPGEVRTHGGNFKPVLTLKTQITFLKTAPPATPIGYGKTYITPRKALIATLPIGYNDGYSALLSNKARVIVHGKYASVVGGITMDYIMIDVTEIEGVKVGDEVTLIGKEGECEIRIEELASIMGVSPLEVACSIGERVVRVYK